MGTSRMMVTILEKLCRMDVEQLRMAEQKIDELQRDGNEASNKPNGAGASEFESGDGRM